MNKVLTGAMISAGALAAADLEVTVEIPRINAAEYHRPYLAIWVEKPDQTVGANLAVWYDQHKQGAETGTTWLKDLRAWWRKAGRDLKMPADGVSGATRAPGAHVLSFKAAKGALAQLPPGNYHLVVEAAREVGGRELVKVPFEWPQASAKPQQAKGQHELGLIQVTVKP